MRYIGPFFRMSSLSQKEINGQLFYLSKEAIKTLVLESKCGIVSSLKNSKKSPSSIDITTTGNFSPLLCVYRKASPNFIHNKNSNGFDEDSFKKEINPTTNALMTLSLLELADYYRGYENVEKNTYALSTIYNNLANQQLEFYSINLRNNEGVFIDKRNLLESTNKNFNLVDKDKKFKFSDQAFMMLAYYLYYKKNPNDEISKAYHSFAMEILQMFVDFKEKVYECSLEELCKTVLALNIMYNYEPLDNLKALIMDFSDYIISKFDEKDYFIDSLDITALCSMALILSYKHTHILGFLEKSKEISDRLYTLYDPEKETFYKLSSKKDLKYSSFDITFYLLSFIIYGNVCGKQNEYRSLISSIYKKFFISSGVILSWPDAPTLDDYERYRGLTLSSSDMIDESYFRMPTVSNPLTTGFAPIFNKSINYNKRKDAFTTSKITFDSYRNFMIFYLFIFFFKDDYLKETLNVAKKNVAMATADDNEKLEDAPDVDANVPEDIPEAEGEPVTESQDINEAEETEDILTPPTR